MKKFIIFIALLLILIVGIVSCGTFTIKGAKTEEASIIIIDENKDTASIRKRFALPDNFKRMPVDEASFAYYLSSLPLKPQGSKVHTYNGKIKLNTSAYEAVIDIDVGEKNLQQCADAIIRLRAEYQLSDGLKDEISFKLTNGFEVPYSKWVDGWRVKVEGNETSWTKSAEFDDSYDAFRDYLEFVFIYAGTLSLDRDLASIAFDEMKTGDVLINGGSPGHAVIVVDMAENPDTGEKLFMLAQSYMPAQDIHVLANLNDSSISPWYRMEFDGKIKTPEWTFDKANLKRFK